MINLLVSFPRSGNTWMRYILASYFHPEAELILIDNGLKRLTNLEYDVVPVFPNVPPLDVCFLKTHMRISEDGYNLSKFRNVEEMSIRANGIVADHHILLVRNPLDVAASHVNFEHFLYDHTVDNLTSFATKFIQYGSVHESLCWNDYHENWLTHGKPSVIIRYEDMLVDPLGQLRDMFNAIGLEFDEVRMQAAIDRCSLKNLRKLENWDRPDATFFKHGKAHSYRDVMKRDHIRQIVKRMGPTMEKFGYSGDYKDWV